MIGEIIFNHFRFFALNQEMSFFPDLRTKKLMSNAVTIKNKKVLKSLSIYGANNSGKSNLVAMLEGIKSVLLGERDPDFNSVIFDDAPTVDIAITFANIDEGWYRYSFSYDHQTHSYLKESLSSLTYYESGIPHASLVYEKDVPGHKLIINGKDASSLLDVLSSERPLLYTLNVAQGTYASLEEQKNRLMTLAHSLIIVRMFNIPIENTLLSLKGNNEQKKDFILRFVKHADLSVEDFSYRETPAVKAVGDSRIDEKALQSTPGLEEALHLVTQYNGKSVPSIFYDSSGTKKIQSIASYVYDAIHDGKTLVVDELDNGLHYKLTRAIVSAFNNLSNTKGQLLFTAHDLLLVDNKNLMRKDQIYFVERKESQARLVALRNCTVAQGGPREVEALVKRYNHGDFIKVPSPSFIDEIIDLTVGEDSKDA